MNPAGSDLSLTRTEGTKPAPATWSHHTMTSIRPWPDIQTEVVVTSGETPKRVDLFLANRDPALSRAMIQRLIEEGRIRINDHATKPSYKIRSGDRITLTIPRPEPLELKPEAIPLDVLFEDEAVLVLNKPAGLVVHPAPGHWSGTLVHGLLHHFKRAERALSTIGGKERPGLVHRLDKETSGVMVIAKTDETHAGLAAQFKAHSITREYEALVWGSLKKPRGVIELAIGRDTKERKKFSARTARPKPSVTEYQVMARFEKTAAQVLLLPRTGRTHQIRVHLASIGHPVLGDPTYGGRKVRTIGELEIPRVMLHARLLGFIHPVTNRYQQFAADTPADMQRVRAALETL